MKRAPESIFIQVVREAICHFSTCCAPFNKQHAALMHVEIPLHVFLPPASFFLHYPCSKQTNYVVPPACFCACVRPHGYVLGWRRFRGVGWSCRGSGGKPREVLLFLMCCRSPTQPPPPPPPTITINPPTLGWSSY